LISIDIQENKIELQGVDMLDQTPVLDIKPYIPRFDNFEARTGWISKVNSETMRKIISDDRF
jgi:tRNA (Thr-GGU) A37 N-methylase